MLTRLLNCFLESNKFLDGDTQRAGQFSMERCQNTKNEDMAFYFIYDTSRIRWLKISALNFARMQAIRRKNSTLFILAGSKGLFIYLYIYKNELLLAHITEHQSRTGWGMQELMMGASQEYARIDYANLWLPYLGPFTRKMHFFPAQRLRDLYGWNVP